MSNELWFALGVVYAIIGLAHAVLIGICAGENGHAIEAVDVFMAVAWPLTLVGYGFWLAMVRGQQWGEARREREDRWWKEGGHQ